MLVLLAVRSHLALAYEAFWMCVYLRTTIITLQCIKLLSFVIRHIQSYNILVSRIYLYKIHVVAEFMHCSVCLSYWQLNNGWLWHNSSIYSTQRTHRAYNNVHVQIIFCHHFQSIRKFQLYILKPVTSSMGRDARAYSMAWLMLAEPYHSYTVEYAYIRIDTHILFIIFHRFGLCNCASDWESRMRMMPNMVVI